jgi:hypothetical protein
LPKSSHKQRADRSAFLLQLVRDLDRFAADEEPDRILRSIKGCSHGVEPPPPF